MVVVYDNDVSNVIQQWSTLPYTGPHGISLAKDPTTGTYWLYVALNAGTGVTATVKRYDVGSVASAVPTADATFALSPQPTTVLSGIAAHPDGTLLVCGSVSGISRYDTVTGNRTATNSAFAGYTAVDKWDFTNGTHDVYAIAATQTGTAPNAKPTPMAVLDYSTLALKWNVDLPFPGPPPGTIQSYSTWAQGTANGAVANALVVSEDGRLLIAIENYYGAGTSTNNIVSYTPPATSFNLNPVVSLFLSFFLSFLCLFFFSSLESDPPPTPRGLPSLPIKTDKPLSLLSPSFFQGHGYHQWRQLVLRRRPRVQQADRTIAVLAASAAGFRPSETLKAFCFYALSSSSSFPEPSNERRRRVHLSPFLSEGLRKAPTKRERETK